MEVNGVTPSTSINADEGESVINDNKEPADKMPVKSNVKIYNFSIRRPRHTTPPKNDSSGKERPKKNPIRRRFRVNHGRRNSLARSKRIGEKPAEREARLERQRNECRLRRLNQGPRVRRVAEAVELPPPVPWQSSRLRSGSGRGVPLFPLVEVKEEPELDLYTEMENEAQEDWTCTLASVKEEEECDDRSHHTTTQTNLDIEDLQQRLNRLTEKLREMKKLKQIYGANVNPEQRLEVLSERQKILYRLKILKQSPEEKMAAREKRLAKYELQLAKEGPEERAARLKQIRDALRLKILKETPKEKMARLKKNRAKYAEKRAEKMEQKKLSLAGKRLGARTAARNNAAETARMTSRELVESQSERNGKSWKEDLSSDVGSSTWEI